MREDSLSCTHPGKRGPACGRIPYLKNIISKKDRIVKQISIFPEICEKTAKNSCFFDGRVLEYAL